MTSRSTAGARSRTLRRVLAAWPLLVALLCGLLTAFWWRGGFVRGSDVDARVAYMSSGSVQLTDLRLVAGADKTWRPQLAAGDSFRTTLFTHAADTRLLVQFKLNGQQVDWDGPDLGSNVGYRIAIRIDDSGQVTERHCLLPCWFL